MSANSVPAILSKNVGNTLTNYKTWNGIVYNVKDYKAKGDGIADDTAAIQSTINLANANGGGIVLFPPGTYIVTGTPGGNFLDLKTNVTLRGSGIGVTILKLGSVTGLSNAMIAVDPGVNDACIENLTIDGHSFSTQMQYAILQYGNGFRLNIRNVTIQNFYATLGHVYILDSFYAHIENVTIQASSVNAQHGIRLVSTTTTGNYHKVVDCVVNNGGFGFSVIKSSRNDFENCLARADSLTASLEGFNIDGGQNNNFDNCSAYSRGDAGYIETDIDAGVVPTGNRVNGFTAVGNKLNGINIAGTDGVYTGLVAQNNGADGASVSQTYGVICVSGATRNIISDVFSYDNQGVHTQTVGFMIQSGASEIYPTNIHGYGNSLCLMQDEATSRTNGNPKFLATKNGANQTGIVSGVNTKVTFSTEKFDMGGYFDTATSRYTPKRAGVYQFHGVITWSDLSAGAWVYLEIQKNGALYRDYYTRASATGTFMANEIQCMVDMNGTTDYIELFVHQETGGNRDILGGEFATWFEGRLVD